MLWYNVCAGHPASSMRKILTGMISEREKIQVFDICMDMFTDLQYSSDRATGRRTIPESYHFYLIVLHILIGK
jgi:hypothetical protein